MCGGGGGGGRRGGGAGKWGRGGITNILPGGINLFLSLLFLFLFMYLSDLLNGYEYFWGITNILEKKDDFFHVCFSHYSNIY